MTPVYDWPYDDWFDDCPPPPPRRWHAAAPPPPRVVVQNPNCTPRFGVNTNWSDNRCAKLSESAAQARAAEPIAPQAPAPHCSLNLGVNRNWLDGSCAKLYGDSAAQPGPAQSTTAPASPPPCVLNLGINRDWLDGNCAKFYDGSGHPAHATGMERLRDLFSSVAHPADWQAYRPIAINVGIGIALVVLIVVVAFLGAGLVRWMLEARARRTRRLENSRLSRLAPGPLAASVRTGPEPSDPRTRQARELLERADELQTALFGQT